MRDTQRGPPFCLLPPPLCPPCGGGLGGGGSCRWPSRLLDCRAEPAERRPQVVIANMDSAEAICAAASRSSAGDGLLFLRTSGAWCRRRPPMACQPKKRLTRSRMIAERCSNFERRRPFHPQHQCPRLRRVAVLSARPPNFFGLGVFGDVGADDFRPSRHKLGRCKALFGKGCVQCLVRNGGKRLRLPPAGLVHAVLLCQIVRT